VIGPGTSELEPILAQLVFENVYCAMLATVLSDKAIVPEAMSYSSLSCISQYCHNDVLHYCNCNKMDLASFVVIAIGCDASSCNKANKPQLLADFLLGIGFPFPFWLDSIIQPPMTQWIFPTGYKGGILTNDRMWPKREVLYIIRSVFLRRF
jgi:hypothetical protein